MSYSNAIRGAGAPALLLVAVALVAAASPARAQAPADGRWVPWLGCWETVAPAGQQAVAAPAQVCIHAAAGAPGVTFSNLLGGRVLGHFDVVADGTRRPISEGGCRGWETATWSRDAHRVFRRTELDCDGGARRTSTGVIAFLPDDQWVEVDAAGSPNNRGVRVLRYRTMAPSAAAATGLMPQGEDLAIQTGRAAAAAPLLTSDVVEASRQIDAVALQALVYQRGNGYGLNAQAARQLADARVPSDVIDLMVALSYPDYFDINRGTAIALRNDEARGGGGGSGRMPGPWGGWGCYGYDRYYGYSGYGASGYYGYPGWIYSYPLSYGYYNPCWGGYGPYGGLWGGGWGWYGPYGGVIEVGDGSSGGRIVKGHGYSPPSGSGSSGRSARPKGGSSSGGSASVGKSGGGSSSAGKSGSSGGSSSSGRTAKPKGSH